jgi:hypothetical protein
LPAKSEADTPTKPRNSSTFEFVFLWMLTTKCMCLGVPFCRRSRLSMSLPSIDDIPDYETPELTQAADFNVHGAHHLLPAAAKVHLHELASENAVLKARLRSTVQELKNTRDLCHRMSSQGSKYFKPPKAHDASATTKDAVAQTKELKGLRPLAAALRSAGTSGPAASLTSCTVAIQTNVGGKDCIVMAAGGDTAMAIVSGGVQDEVRRLKAEVLRSHAECASLHHAIQIMKTHGSPRAASPGRGSASSDRALFPDDEPSETSAVSVAKASHLASMERIATLTEALKLANEKIADLEREAIKSRSVVAHDDRRVAELPSAAAHQTATLKLNKATITDDAQLDVRLPSSQEGLVSTDAATRVMKSSALEQALSITRAQLSEALDELSSLRGSHPRAPTASNPDLRRVSVGVTADLHQPLVELFRAHGMALTGEAVEELLAVRSRHLELVRRTRELEANALSSTNSAVVRELTTDLENARKELTAAHQHIDELHYALELEKRERFNPQNLLQRYSAADATATRDTIVLSDDAQKQAAAEISFLCDTLAATKSDAESLRAQLEQASLERDSALHSFRELKAKTESVLLGCQQITEATRADADAAIASLTHTVRTKDSEIFSLRGQLAALQREFEKATKALHASQLESDAVKQRVAAVQSAMSKLREDSNAQAAQLREVRAQLAAHHASALSSPRGTNESYTPRVPRVKPTSADKAPAAHRSPHTPVNVSVLSGIQALQQELDRKESEGDAARRLQEFGSPSPTLTRSEPRSPSRRRTPKASSLVPPKAEGSPSDELSAEQLRQEYEELRSCFIELSAVAPNATTAREVTDALVAALDAQKERCSAVEKELRKRTTALQTLKKELNVSRDTVLELDKRTSQASALEQRVTALGRQLDKQKRAAVQLATEKTESEEAFKLRIAELEAELERTREALSAARQELREGRELMLTLIGEDDEALAAIGNHETASQRTTESRLTKDDVRGAAAQ